MTLNERQHDTPAMPDGLLDLMHELEATWPDRSAALRASGVPLNEGEEGGDGGTEGEGDGGAGGSGEAGKGGSAGADGGDRTFSQADVDRIVQERVARVKATPPDDYDDLKAKAAEFDKVKESQKTELEKAQERAATLERERDEARTASQETNLRSAIVTEAARKNVVDPDAAVALIDRSNLEFDDDGNATNIAETMDSLLKAKPYLVGGGNGRADGADQGARGGKGQHGSTEGMTSAEIAAAALDGSLDTYLKTPSK